MTKTVKKKENLLILEYMDWMKQLSLFHQLKDKMEGQKTENFNENYKRRVLDMLAQREQMIENMNQKVNLMKNGVNQTDAQDNLLIGKIEELENRLQTRLKDEQHGRIGSNQMEQKLNYMFDMMMYNMSSMQQMMNNVAQMQKAQNKISVFQTQMLRNLPFLKGSEPQDEDPFAFMKSKRNKRKKTKKHSKKRQTKHASRSKTITSKHQSGSGTKKSSISQSSQYSQHGDSKQRSSVQRSRDSLMSKSKQSVHHVNGSKPDPSSEFKITTKNSMGLKTPNQDMRRRSKKPSKIATAARKSSYNSDKSKAKFRFSGRNTQELKALHPLKPDKIIEPDHDKRLTGGENHPPEKAEDKNPIQGGGEKLDTGENMAPDAEMSDFYSDKGDNESVQPEKGNNEGVDAIKQELINRILRKRQKIGTDSVKMRIESPEKVRRKELEKGDF